MEVGSVTPSPEQPEYEGCPKCGGDGGDNWFDRSICPEPCGMMHTRCSNCGHALDNCPFDSAAEQPEHDDYAREQLAKAREAGERMNEAGEKVVASLRDAAQSLRAEQPEHEKAPTNVGGSPPRPNESARSVGAEHEEARRLAIYTRLYPYSVERRAVPYELAERHVEQLLEAEQERDEAQRDAEWERGCKDDAMADANQHRVALEAAEREVERLRTAIRLHLSNSGVCPGGLHAFPPDAVEGDPCACGKETW
jgi:hypothetical protein